MKYLYYKSKKGNFGDDLNAWLWPRVFKDLIEKKDVYFLGIGSILHSDSHVIKDYRHEKKIIFGTEVKPSVTYKNLITDDLWDVRFLRGPLSSQALNNKYEYIADAAYAIRLIENFDKFEKAEKKYEISLMPYFHSVEYFDWEGLCKELGYHYISPLSENGVEFTLDEIAASKVVITEAMHGAILADALRVPWHRFVFSTPFTEGGRISDFKWMDWCHSIGVYTPDITYIPFHKKNIIHKWVKKLSSNKISIDFLSKKHAKKDLVSKLGVITSFNLSQPEVLCEIDRKILVKINELKSEFSGPR